MALKDTEQYDLTGSGAEHGAGLRFYLVCKRLGDFLISALSLVVLILPMLLIALLIRLDSPGPAIFRQERLGKGGRPFTMFKFRTMILEAEEDGPQWAKENDERCTRIGFLLRKTRMDELPQLVNILMGQMSFVGPRPERACFYDEFEVYIPHFRKRLQVLPGLTGLAQVNGGYDLLPEEKIVYDLEYIRNRSFGMDLRCIWKTVQVVFTHDGAR